nr:MAG TPA: hypothetical protein [Caudoviricetes sp.]
MDNIPLFHLTRFLYFLYYSYITHPILYILLTNS